MVFFSTQRGQNPKENKNRNLLFSQQKTLIPNWND